MYETPNEDKLLYLCLQKKLKKDHYKIYPCPQTYFEILDLNRQINALKRFLTSSY